MKKLLGKNIKYSQLSEKSFDGGKLSRITQDEMGMWSMQFGKSLNLWIIYIYYRKHFFWVRLFNNWYGVSGKKIKENMFLLFSERNGLHKTLKIFGWQFRILKPFKLKHR